MFLCEDLAAHEHNILEEIRDYDPAGPMDEVDSEIHPNDVLDGQTELNISHSGGEFHDGVQEAMEEERQRALYVSCRLDGIVS